MAPENLSRPSVYYEDGRDSHYIIILPQKCSLNNVILKPNSLFISKKPEQSLDSMIPSMFMSSIMGFQSLVTKMCVYVCVYITRKHTSFCAGGQNHSALLYTEEKQT